VHGWARAGGADGRLSWAHLVQEGNEKGYTSIHPPLQRLSGLALGRTCAIFGQIWGSVSRVVAIHAASPGRLIHFSLKYKAVRGGMGWVSACSSVESTGRGLDRSRRLTAVVEQESFFLLGSKREKKLSETH
jgi:hypothetical protein